MIIGRRFTSGHARGRPRLPVAVACILSLSLTLVPHLQAQKPPRLLSDLRFAEFGNQFECYFTIEELREEGQHSRAMGIELPEGFAPSSREDMIKRLAKALPGSTVAADKAVPAVIRITDKQLLKRKDYGLDRDIDLSFKGSPEELLRWLGEKKTGVTVPNGGGFGTIYATLDGRTPLHIQRHKGSVRHLLTAYLPLSNYRRLIWIADSTEKDGKLETRVRFRGGMHNLRKDVPAKEVNFSEGHSAYIYNQGTKGGVASAIGFIEKQMKEKEPVPQVRWAILFLGREKAEKGIHILLKHLEYRYTPWGVVGEAHPAVKALAQIGDPACNACVEDLRTEERTPRQRLLAQVLLDSWGLAKARKTLKEERAKTKDEAQRKRLEALDEKLIEWQSRSPHDNEDGR
jgi:hypothetical protein